MINRYIKSTILNNGRLTIQLTGKIMKVCVITNIPSTAWIKIYNKDTEVILDTKLSTDKNIFYPINSIPVQDLQVTKDDYFVNEGELNIEITDLNAGEWINSLSIVYES